MKIFVPSQKDKNPYFDEMIRSSENIFIFRNYLDYTQEFEIVNIHFPEAIFNWREPSQLELEDLEEQIKRWKQSAKVVYTRHDAHRLLGETPRFKQLFMLVEKNADAIIHLGEYSKKQLLQVYPHKIHKVIPHPLYENSFNKIEKRLAREKLGISQDSFVVIAAGRIRNKQERKMLLKAFKSLPVRKKVLLSNNMLPFTFNLNFPGRVRLKKIVDVNKVLTNYKKQKYQSEKFQFHYNFISFSRFSLMMSASDVVFIPRIDILNSGNLFLGLTYKKLVIGPAVGNLKEHLEKFELPQFDPSSIQSVKYALKKGHQLYSQKQFQFDEQEVGKYGSQQVFKQLDDFFLCLTK